MSGILNCQVMLLGELEKLLTMHTACLRFCLSETPIVHTNSHGSKGWGDVWVRI